jgi:hypothetical protein
VLPELLALLSIRHMMQYILLLLKGGGLLLLLELLALSQEVHSSAI